MAISACCEGARRLETRGDFGGYHCPDHGLTLLTPTADPPAGPFPPSTRGNQVNVGISPARLFDQAFTLGWDARARNPRGLEDDRFVEMAAALKKADLP